MPSTYTPPEVTVRQVRRTVIANNFLPQLPVVVVGPARQIVVRAPAGTYDPALDFVGGMPTLIPGANTDLNSVEVVLEAKGNTGKPLGTFKVDPIDFSISDDGTQLTVDAGIALEYSLLSLRNNAGSLISNDSAIAQTHANLFSDKQVDFLSRGASRNADSFILVNSPANQVGRYRIYDLISSGTKVNTVKAELVDSEDVPVLTYGFNLLAAANGRFVYGYPATHELTGHTVNTSSANALGVGVKGIIAAIASGDIGTLFHAPIDIPDLDSGDVVEFDPDSTGKGLDDWITLVNAAKVGNYLRITLATPLIRDFKIVAVDVDNLTLSIENEDFTGTGSTSTAAADVTDIKLLEVLKGSDDAFNAAGDVLTGEANGVIPFDREIKRATPGAIELVSVLPTLSGTAVTPIVMRRGAPFNSESTVYDITKEIDSGFTATILVSFQAQRTDLTLNGMIELSDQNSIEQTLGLIHPDNVIALMADMVRRSGFVNPAQTFYAVVTADSTLAAFEDAISVLERADVYFVVPATQDKDILDLYKNHVDGQSQPEQKHERVCLGTTPLITFEQQIPPLPTTTLPVGTAADPLLPRKFASSTVDWTLIETGDNVLKLMSSSNPDTATVLATYRIESVNVAGQYCTLNSDIDSQYLSNSQFFKIDTYPFDEFHQSEAWRDEAASYKDFRFMMIRPDLCELEYTDKTGAANVDTDVIVPTYYMAALFAGMKATLPPEQPMTNVPLPGINRLFHSNTYFTPEQLNTIAEGGNAIFVQKTRQASPFCRHQLTTDMSSIFTREFSIVVCVDFTAKFLRNSMEPYVGNHVISAEYLTQLRGIMESLIRALVGAGTLLAGTTLDGLYQDPDQPDQVIVNITLEVPIPCNKIKITLYI